MVRYGSEPKPALQADSEEIEAPPQKHLIIDLFEQWWNQLSDSERLRYLCRLGIDVDAQPSVVGCGLDSVSKNMPVQPQGQEHT